MVTGRGEFEAAVAPFRATVRPDGTAEPIDPPHETDEDWMTAAWITQSAYPASPARGRSYVYGHACRHHVCAFDELAGADVGATATVTTEDQVLTYRFCGRGLSPKTTNLIVPACSDGLSADLVLVTCEFDENDISTTNLVLVATLTAGTNR